MSSSAKTASKTEVIFLEAHPAWVAARQRERLCSESMRRHPSFRAQHRATSTRESAMPVARYLRACPDTPA